MVERGTKQEREARRYRAVALLSEGHGVCHVAELLGVTPGAVSQWKTSYEAGGEAGLRSKKHPGAKPKLSPEERQQLPSLLLAGPPSHGVPNHLWTLDRVAQVIERALDVAYHPAHVGTILQGLGWGAQSRKRRAQRTTGLLTHGVRRSGPQQMQLGRQAQYRAIDESASCCSSWFVGPLPAGRRPSTGWDRHDRPSAIRLDGFPEPTPGSLLDFHDGNITDRRSSLPVQLGPRLGRDSLILVASSIVRLFEGSKSGMAMTSTSSGCPRMPPTSIPSSRSGIIRSTLTWPTSSRRTSTNSGSMRRCPSKSLA
jgi:transposase